MSALYVHYQLTRDELIAFATHYARTTRAWRRSLQKQQARLFFIGIVVTFLWPRWSLWARIIFFAVSSLLALLAPLIYFNWYAGRFARALYVREQNIGAVNNHTVALDANGVIVVMDVGEQRISWRGIEKIEDTDKYILLFVSTTHAHLIPKSAFLNEGEAAAFYRTALDYRAGATSLPDGAP